MALLGRTSIHATNTGIMLATKQCILLHAEHWLVANGISTDSQKGNNEMPLAPPKNNLLEKSWKPFLRIRTFYKKEWDSLFINIKQVIEMPLATNQCATRSTMHCLVASKLPVLVACVCVCSCVPVRPLPNEFQTWYCKPKPLIGIEESVFLIFGKSNFLGYFVRRRGSF